MEEAANRPRARPKRWTAPAATVVSLVFLAPTYLSFSLASWTFLEVPETENAALARRFEAASRHASGMADRILIVALAIALAGGLLGLIRPRRHLGTLVIACTALALVLLWATTRADIALLTGYR